jgi:twitching motility protein PilT
MTTHLDNLLEMLVHNGASDLHLKVGSRPFLRINGQMCATDGDVLTTKDAESYARAVLAPEASKEFAKNREANVAHGTRSLGRFRVNVSSQRGSMSLVFRHVPHVIPSLADLGLDPVVDRIKDLKRGLIVIAGGATSGKTTTAASIIDHLNLTRAANIVTVEDPIEILHSDKQSMVSQREIGIDTDDYARTLRGVFRQDVDVIFIDRLQDAETLKLVLDAVEAGHLVIATMPAANVSETLTRLVSMASPGGEPAVREQLATHLVAVCAQRLIPAKSSGERVPLFELMLQDDEISDCIRDDQTFDRIPHLLETKFPQMLTFDQAVVRHYETGEIDFETAKTNVSSTDILEGITPLKSEPVLSEEPKIPALA